MRRFILLTLSLAITGCVREDSIASVAQPTIYGTDDRMDVYAHPDARLRQLAQQSSVVLVDSGSVDTTDPSNVRLTGDTLGVQESLCAGQRFIDDPAPGFCSGTLIDTDLVLTAGHCVPDGATCRTTQFVFNFYRDSATTLHTITRDDVYSCAGIVVQTETGSPYRDYAVLRLDRPVTAGHVPAAVHRAHDLLTTGAPVAMIGFPSGIPAKIDSGGHVRDPGTGNAFLATTDSFHGNSGSAIYDLTAYEIRGNLITGDADYDQTSAGCYVTHMCSETGCSGETSVYVWHAMDALCAADPTALPCGTTQVDAGSEAGADASAGDAAPGADAASDASGSSDGARADGAVGDGGLSAAGGCGCRAGTGRSGPSGMLVVMMSGLALAGSRRSRRSRWRAARRESDIFCREM